MVVAEKILDNRARQNMSEWDLERFKRDFPTLFQTIMEAMKDSYNDGFHDGMTTETIVALNMSKETLSKIKGIETVRSIYLIEKNK
jgi:hypothetical protein